MKILAIHADYLNFEAKKKAIKDPEPVEQAKEAVKECLVVFTAVEERDEENPDSVLKQMVQHVKDISGRVNTERVVLYPYAHLSSSLGKPAFAVKMLSDAKEALAKEGLDVSKSPFGWYKSFEISCKGHPLSELSKEIKPEEGDEQGDATDAVKAEEKLESHWHIMTPDGELHDVGSFDYKGHDALKRFAHYETEKDRSAPAQPHHVKMMQQLELVDYEPASDSGNLRYYPKGRLIKKLLEEFVTDKVVDYGGVEVETPIMYDINHPSLSKYLQRFPARQYRIKSDKDTYFLRFAACFGQFLTAHDATISYKHLPLKLYELTRYSFRHEQRGELTGLRRLRAFTMPDVHALCSDLEQAMAEYKVRFGLSLSTLESIGFSRDDFEMALRVTKAFYEENKDFVQYLVKTMGKPILVEMWDERKFYFVLKYEFNFVDANKKASALSTDQIDIENGERYDMRFMNEKGSSEVVPYVLHCSPSGAIERVMYALLERTWFQEKRGETPRLPLWLSPTQVRFIPVNPERHLERCEELAERLHSSQVRVDIADEHETIGKRIRDASKEWVPYIVVVGDRDLEGDELTVRIRGRKEQVQMSFDELVKGIKDETAGLPWKPLPLPRLISKRPAFRG
ncbi:threonine--tRNA ligase [Candidatus Woesearchaeota archaeon]|nr:threonine--tRNA ligase [Candidatus Woesearchaeota archaeon]